MMDKIKGFFTKLKSVDWKNADVKTLFAKPDDEYVTGTAATFEISLVPEVKAQAIKALKTRNIVLFICIIIIAVSGGLVGVLGSVVTGQNLTMSNQDKRIEAMSEKINSFDGLEEYLTIQDQLGNISTIQENRKVLSRIFSFLNVMLPNGPDTITISELDVDLSDNTISFTGQADAGVEPFIDYRVLEAFKKAVALVKYDYGRYVDADGEEIPTRCMVESNSNGAILSEDNNVYAYWLTGESDCGRMITERDLALAELAEEIEAAAEDGTEMTETEIIAAEKAIYEEYKDSITNNWYDEWLEANGLTRYTDNTLSDEETQSADDAYNAWYDGLSDEEKWIVDTELDDGVARKDVRFEKVYRTPQFEKWYKNENMDLSGTVDGVPHFESQCISYSGTELDNSIRWTLNNECMLLDEEVSISNSSNGRDASGNLVLRFEASAVLAEDPLMFENKHVMAIGPNGQNVTDSYVQIEGIFSEEAEDCQSSDVVCVSNSANVTGEENGE